VALRPKAFAALRYLAERPGQLATKEEISAHVWEGTAVASGGSVFDEFKPTALYARGVRGG
jgi:DNA-binding winged helix-turn-helix (wHTH) protein